MKNRTTTDKIPAYFGVFWLFLLVLRVLNVIHLPYVFLFSMLLLQLAAQLYLWWEDEKYNEEK